MALTFTKVKAFPQPIKGGFRLSIWDLTCGTGDYPTGGYTIAAASFFLNGLLAVVPVGAGASLTAAAIPFYNFLAGGAGSTANGKLQMLVGAAAGAELQEAAASLAALNGQIYRVLVIGW